MACQRLSPESARDILSNVDNFMFDCDGVLWSGPKLIPGSLETIVKLKKMDDIVCTAYTAALYLKSISFKGKIYLVGNPAIAEELDKFGFQYIGLGPDRAPDGASNYFNPALLDTQLDPEVNCVLVGFDIHLSYYKMMKAATYARRKDCIFIATNEDSHLPCDGDIVIPGTGSIVAACKIPARREPIIIGKPSTYGFTPLQKLHNLDPSRTLMVGDQCTTDIAFGRKCGLRTLLVFTGVLSKSDLEQLKQSTDSETQEMLPEFCTSSFADLMDLSKNS
ncbi:hypothetical protein ACJMK2_021083 [Sinanodonta woodiana]|uniref:Phosphoglycolate phosphatase n=1 Tax=Sinanodonta woodiana TaxID=1069815 RepID=A0ABD3U2J4_SINWO